MKLFLFLLFIFYFSISSAQQKSEPVRGTWITNVAGDVLLSEKNIKLTVKLCKQKGLNNIYVVV